MDRHPCLWNVDDVVNWARSVKLSEATTRILRDNEVDGPTLVTLTQQELRSELNIRSLPARRYLYGLIEKLRDQQNSADFLAAVQVHEGEIGSLKLGNSSPDPDVASGGGHKPVVDGAVISALESDAALQRQILNDHLLALRAQAGMNVGEDVFVDSELARVEQRRLDELAIVAEFDHRYAATLPRETVDRRRSSSSRRPAAPQQAAAVPGNEVQSLFALAVEACSANRVNVAKAIQRAQHRIFGQDAALVLAEDEQETIQLVTDEGTDAESDADDVQELVHGHDGRRDLAVVQRTRDLPELHRCNVCYETSVKGIVLACGHPYCVVCLRNLFQTVLRDSSLLPIRCCDVPVDTSLASLVLRRRDVELLSKRIQEFEAKRKMYCPSCSEFVNLDLIDADMVDFNCDCGLPLCAVCATAAHPTMSCRQNQAQQAGHDSSVLELAQSLGWKQCPKCSHIIEFKSGCNHMTCRCGHDFCYTCLAPWSARTGLCSSNRCALWQEERLVEAAEVRVQQIVGNRAIAQPERARLLQREVRALENHEVCDHHWTRENCRELTCERCSYTLWVYGMRCRSDCRAMVCYTCAHHRIPQRGWR